MNTEPVNPERPKSKRLYVSIILLSAALAGALTILAWGMVHYRVPERFWKHVADVSDPIPALTITTEFRAPPIIPLLAFPENTETHDELLAWQQRGKDKLRELLHPSPKSVSLSVHITAKDKVGTLTRETLIFTRPDGAEVPAFLFIPNEKTVRPAVVVVPGHSRGIVATGGIVDDYQHANAMRIAEAGYVVLTMEVRGFGYLSRMTHSGELVVLDSYVAHLLTRGQTAMGIVIGDLMDGISYLVSRDEVDEQQIGAVGFSSGGKTVIYLAALDERVDVVVASGCVTDHEHNFLHSRHDAYEAIPQLGRWLSFSDCMGLIASRPMLVQWGRLDTNVVLRNAAFNAGAMPTYEAVSHIYDTAGATGALKYYISESLGHEYDNAPAITFLKKMLPLKF